MAINFVTNFDNLPPDPRNDVIFRQRRAVLKREEAKETYKTEKITVEYGLPDEKTHKKPSHSVVLRYAVDSEYIFAVFGENPAFADTDAETWRAVAAEAIHRWSATHSFNVKLGPRPEDGNRYNMMAELDRKIEVSDRVKKAEARAIRDREARLAAMRAAEEAEEDDE